MTTTLAFALRAAVAADIEFEQLLYSSTRDDLRPLGPEVFDGLVGMQFRAQSMSIKLDHPQADRKIVVVDEASVGRLIVDGSGDHIEVIDVALLPQFRGHGIGTNVLRSILAEADRVGRAVRLHVEKRNRAVRLYERLGFAICGDLGMYVAMSRWLNCSSTTLQAGVAARRDQPAMIGSKVSSGSSLSRRCNL